MPTKEGKKPKDIAVCSPRDVATLTYLVPFLTFVDATRTRRRRDATMTRASPEVFVNRISQTIRLYVVSMTCQQPQVSSFLPFHFFGHHAGTSSPPRLLSAFGQPEIGNTFASDAILYNLFSFFFFSAINTGF